MKRDTVLFDVNETLLDLSSLKPLFQQALGSESVTATWFSMLLHSSTVCSLTNTQSNFATLAGIMLDTLAARMKLSVSSEMRQAILGGFASLPAHPDIVPALTKLRSAGYRTVAFSNSSHDLVSNRISNAGLSDHFNDVLSVEKTGIFKPDRRVYEYAADKLNRPMTELRLIATHDWDTHGAMSAGLLAGYIDRNGAPYHPLYLRPDVYAADMTDVVEQVIQQDL